MEELILTGFNLDKICRVCLLEYENMFSIHSQIFEENSEQILPKISEILTDMSSIKIQADDGLPILICTKCINNVHNFFKFQQQCNRSQTLLDTYIQQLNECTSLPTNHENVNLGVSEVILDKTLDSSHASTVNDLLMSSVKDLELIDFIDLKPSKIIEQDNIEPVNTSIQNDTSKETDLDKNDDFMSVNEDILRSELDFMNDNVKDTSDIDDEDCDALKNCIPLGEDTVDQLIKDNLQVESLDLISPKLKAFGFNFKTAKDEEDSSQYHKITSKKLNNFKTGPRPVPNMHYYKKSKLDGTLEFQCNLCEKKFRFPQSLRIHLKGHNADKPYICSECNKPFKSYGNLLHHSHSHSGEQPYECKECGKRYRQSGTLTAHMRIHTGLKPFLCKICGKGFRQAPDLTYHMRTHTKEKPYMCTFCGRTMSMQCHLVQHMRIHTGEKPFKCSECDKAFPSSTRLKRHKIIHTTLKPYKCSICDKAFNRKSTLQVHKKIHNGIKPHVCSICNKAFMWGHALRSHLLRHSNKSDKKAAKEMKVKSEVCLQNLDVNDVIDSSLAAFIEKSDILDSMILSDALDDNFNTKEMITVYPTDNTGNMFQIFALNTSNDKNESDVFTLYAADSVVDELSSLSMSVQQPGLRLVGL